MNIAKIELAIEEASRFIKRAEKLKSELEKENVDRNAATGYYYGRCLPKETGFVRRSSMDLTRALADLRKPTE